VKYDNNNFIIASRAYFPHWSPLICQTGATAPSFRGFGGVEMKEGGVEQSQTDPYFLLVLAFIGF
jgi:hypothetical protein